MSDHIPTAHEVETYGGQYVNTADPDPETIDLYDVAHALSNVCRYGGHCQHFYSVAEHAVFVSKRLAAKGYSVQMQLAGLHHDDAEAYLGDIPRPMKPLLGRAYTDLTRKMDRAILKGLELDQLPHALGVGLFHHPAVKDADNYSLFVEARHLLPSKGLHWFKGEQGADSWGLGDQPRRIRTPTYWTGGFEPEAARTLFLERHIDLIERTPT